MDANRFNPVVLNTTVPQNRLGLPREISDICDYADTKI